MREVPGGLFSSWLVRDLAVGDTVEVQTPTGTFQADPATSGRHLCIAAGSGITPVLSIAASALVNPRSQVTLLYGNRKTDTVMFAEELADLKNRYPDRLELVHVLSREPRDVELFSGRLDADRLRRLLTLLVPLRSIDHVWLCGPFGLITDARAVLDELGFPRDRVHFELFFVDEPPPEVHHAEAVIDGRTSDVTIVLDGRTTTAAMPQDQSILDAAAATRSDLPFACKGGVCGTCRARVTSGRGRHAAQLRAQRRRGRARVRPDLPEPAGQRGRHRRLRRMTGLGPPGPRPGAPGYDRATVLRRAIDLFNRQGYDATSVGDLARELGLAKSAIYHHFASKEALLSAALDEALDGLTAAVDTALAATGTDASQRLRAVVRESVEILVQRLPAVTLLLRVRGNSEVELAALKRRRILDDKLAALVAEAVAEGSLRPDGPADAGLIAQAIVTMAFDGLATE